MPFHYTPQTDLKVLIHLPQALQHWELPPRAKVTSVEGNTKHISVSSKAAPHLHTPPQYLSCFWKVDISTGMLRARGRLLSLWTGSHWLLRTSLLRQRGWAGWFLLVSSRRSILLSPPLFPFFFFPFFKGTLLKCPPPCWSLLTTSEVTARNSPYPLDLVCSFSLQLSVITHSLTARHSPFSHRALHSRRDRRVIYS